MNNMFGGLFPTGNRDVWSRRQWFFAAWRSPGSRLLLAGFFCILTVACYSQRPGNQEVAWFDSRLLLLSHPLMQQFDPRTGRFRDTSSAPVSNGVAGLQQLDTQLAELKRELTNLDARYQKEQRSLQAVARKQADEAYLRAKAELQNRQASLEQRSVAATAVPGLPGMTGYESIEPQIREVAEDIRKVVLQLRTQFHIGVVLDVASLSPLHESLIPAPNVQTLFGNRHFFWWKKQGLREPRNIPWLEQASLFWAKHPGWGFDPVPLGGKDYRNITLQLLKIPRGGGR